MVGGTVFWIDGIVFWVGGTMKFGGSKYNLYFSFKVASIENLLKSSSWSYATGDEAQLIYNGSNEQADVFLAPQILKATKRFQIDMSPFPTLVRLNEVYSELSAFQSALPERQPDAHASS
ncbi:glutathione S-transferase Z1-like [Asparagus officinalis]|uniref:glutathione S-transferase Z1-like n=1 Tax=Asparagus officinalis TaxID=4686 RepID=UPI00098E11EA|nr:glutathione S-transferase Z1-like [Asparagus officinalis]